MCLEIWWPFLVVILLNIRWLKSKWKLQTSVEQTFQRWCNGSVIMMVERFIFVLLCFYFFFSVHFGFIMMLHLRIVFNFLYAIGSDYKTFSNKTLTEQDLRLIILEIRKITKKNNYKNQPISILQINLDFQIKINTFFHRNKIILQRKVSHLFAIRIKANREEWKKCITHALHWHSCEHRYC